MAAFSTNGHHPRTAAVDDLLLQVQRLTLSEALRVGYRDFRVTPYDVGFLPAPDPERHYVLYAHVPFCRQLCPYCFFTRFTFAEDLARRYYALLREELRIAADLGYEFGSIYIGGGTPTVLIDELLETIDVANQLFKLSEISVETNPNDLKPEVVGQLAGRVDRLSVGIQTFDDGLLKQVQRYEKYGSGEHIHACLRWAASQFQTVNADMIFNLPTQTEAMLRRDIDMVKTTGVNQTTFHPLMTSPMTAQALGEAVGRVDYTREAEYYHIVTEELSASFQPASAWAFSRIESGAIDEYFIDYPEYVGLGLGSFSYLGGVLYVNVFGLHEYEQALSAGRMSVGTIRRLSLGDQMRYQFMTDLFGLRLDKRHFEAQFGVPVARALWKEMAFMRASRAFAVDDDDQLVLSERGRYLMTVMMREFFVRVNTVRENARAELEKAGAAP